MALPSDSNIKSLQFSKDGSPWVRVAAKSGIDTDGLSYSLDGSPWWGVEVGGAPPAATWKLYVGSVQVTTMYVGNTEVTNSYVGNNVLKS
jgi:hypothetical protein